ncbi:unnamed protein product [Closterium sp. NIES-54]
MGPNGFALNGVPFYRWVRIVSRRCNTLHCHSYPASTPHSHPRASGPLSPCIVAANPPPHILPISHRALLPAVHATPRDTPGKHSPLLGFLAVGIPLYGPRGAGGELPLGVDEYGGHVGDGSGGEPAFYHYHASSTTPYTIACLKGCVAFSDWGNVGSASCTHATNECQGMGVARGVSGKSCEHFQLVAYQPRFFTLEPYLLSSPLLSCPPLFSPLLCSTLFSSSHSLLTCLLILPLSPQNPPPCLRTPEQYDYSSLAAVEAAFS